MVEDIMTKKKKKVRKKSKKKYKIKWKEYVQMIWKFVENFKKTEALD